MYVVKYSSNDGDPPPRKEAIRAVGGGGDAGGRRGPPKRFFIITYLQFGNQPASPGFVARAGQGQHRTSGASLPRQKFKRAFVFRDGLSIRTYPNNN